MKLSLLTFNTQGTPLYSPDITLRYKKFCEIINIHNPDIICFQEIVTYYHLFLLKKYLNYPYFIFKPFLHAPKGGLVIVSRLPLVNVRFVKFTAVGSLWNISRMSRIVQNGMLIAEIENTDVTVINTHTFADFEFEWSPTNKFYNIVKSHVEQIAQEVDKQAYNNQNVIAAGDFNIKKNSRLYKYFLKETKSIDVFREFSFPTYYRERLNYKFKAKVSGRIDYIFIKGKKENTQAGSRSHLFNNQEVLSNKKQSFLSDHIGLLVKFDIV